MAQLRPQRHRLRIAMSDDERDSFLAEERTCRIATVGPSGPHATPLWFHWDGSAMWLSSLVRSRRWSDIMRDPRVGVVVDAGEDYAELRGVEISGTADAIGEVPRTGGSAPELAAAEEGFAAKYTGGTMYHDGRHAWLRVTPSKITSWDFRKLGG